MTTTTMSSMIPTEAEEEAEAGEGARAEGERVAARAGEEEMTTMMMKIALIQIPECLIEGIKMTNTMKKRSRLEDPSL